MDTGDGMPHRKRRRAADAERLCEPVLQPSRPKTSAGDQLEGVDIPEAREADAVVPGACLGMRIQLGL